MANANGERERERERERESHMRTLLAKFLQLCGGLGVWGINKATNLSNFLLLWYK